MIRAYRYRLYPTAEQKAYFAKAFGCCRYAYNWCVREHDRIYQETGKTATDFDLINRIREHKIGVPWLNEADSSVIAHAAIRVAKGWDRFFDHTNIHPPHERKKGDRQYQSFTTKGVGLQISFKHNFVRLPIVGFVRARLHRPFRGEVKCATVKQNAAGRYHISMYIDTGYDLPPMKPLNPDTALGIDLGVRHFATLSTGEHIDMPDVSRSQHRRAFLQRRLKHQQPGSKGYKKTQQQIARLGEHISNVHMDFHEKTAARLCRDHSAICMETLNVEGMRQAVGQKKEAKNSGFNRQLQHVGLGQFSEIVESKALRTGTHFVRTDQWEPTTKRCHVCGYTLPTITLSTEQWSCPECHTRHDRDHNAAINIRDKGIKLLKAKPKEKLPLAERNVKPAKVPVPTALRTGKATDAKAVRRPSTQIDDGTARPRLALYPQQLAFLRLRTFARSIDIPENYVTRWMLHGAEKGDVNFKHFINGLSQLADNCRNYKYKLLSIIYEDDETVTRRQRTCNALNDMNRLIDMATFSEETFHHGRPFTWWRSLKKTDEDIAVINKYYTETVPAMIEQFINYCNTTSYR